MKPSWFPKHIIKHDSFITIENNFIMMKKQLFKVLVKLNKLLLPSYYQKDPMKLTTFQKAILGFRYWALTNSLK